MFYYKHLLLSLFFTSSVFAIAKHTPKQSIHCNTTFPTNSVSSSGTIAVISATNKSTQYPKTIKHPHSHPSGGTGSFSTGTFPCNTNSSGHGLSRTGSVTATNLSTIITAATSSLRQSASSTAPPTGTPTTFKIQIGATFGTDGYPNPPPIEGNSVFLTPGTPGAGEAYDEGAYVMEVATDASQASIFTLNADGTLQSGDLISALPSSQAYSGVSFETQSAIDSKGFYKSVCEIDDGGLSCATNTGSYYTDDVLFTCSNGPYYVEVGPTSRPYDPCFDLELVVVPT